MPLRQADRLKGAENSRAKRRLKKEERRQRAKQLHDAEMSKQEIAKILRVSYRTIMSDFRAIESEIERLERNTE